MDSKGIDGIRKEYGQGKLDPSDCLPDPIRQFKRWMEQAIEAGLLKPTAMTLATVDAAGRPSARIVLLKGLHQGRFLFFTHHLSRKGEQLAENPHAALTFFWPALERQVRIEGKAERLETAASDAYFASRPRESQLSAWASTQSRDLDSRETLLQRIEDFKAQFPGPVPRPPDWGGYALTPDRMEFWQGRPGRLHDRVLYLPAPDNLAPDLLTPNNQAPDVPTPGKPWTRRRLFP